MNFLQTSIVGLFFTSGIVCGLLIGWATVSLYSPLLQSSSRCKRETIAQKVIHDVVPSTHTEALYTLKEDTSKTCSCQCPQQEYNPRDLIPRSHEQLEKVPVLNRTHQSTDGGSHLGKCFILLLI